MVMSGIVQERIKSSKNGIEKLGVEIITSRRAFVRIARQWNELLKRSGNKNLYLSHDWLYSWWLCFGEKTASKLAIVCIYRDEFGLSIASSANDSLIAIGPFYIEKKREQGFSNPMSRVSNKGTLRLLGQADMDINVPECEQLDIISEGNPQDRPLILGILMKQLRKLGRYSNMILQGVTKNSMLYQLISQFPQTHVSGLNATKHTLSLSLPASIDDFISKQSVGWRINYKADRKKAEVLGAVDIRVYSEPHEIHSGLQSLTQLLCSQQRKASAGKCSFDAEHYMKFHEDVCHIFSLDRKVEIVSLVMSGRLLASVCYYKTEDNTIQVYQMASVKGDGIRFSPMMILMMHVIKHLIEQKCSQIDFLSSCYCNDLGTNPIAGNVIELYTLEWYKNMGRAYFYKSARKLYKALHVG